MQTPRGTRDLFGQEIRSMRRVMQVMRNIFEKYGYEEVETPAFEHVELFTKKSGSSIVAQLYTFKDKAGRELALRPELTAPVVRLYIQRLRSAPKPLKLYYFGGCFRYEEPQANRWRQFTQAGVEIIGSGRPEADAEVISLSCEVMRFLGIDFTLRLGNVRVLREVLLEGGIDEDSQDPILRAIDSGEKERVKNELEAARVDKKSANTLLKVSSIRGEPDQMERARVLLKEHPRAAKALEDLAQVMRCLEDYGERNFEVDLGIARGLEYYTNVVFEIYSGGVQLAGGGRYDDLIETLGGEPTPAVGAGFGVERIARVYLQKPGALSPPSAPVVVIPADEECFSCALRLASELRSAGIRTTPELMGRKLTKALAYAGSIGSPYVVIVGKREIERGEATLRDMRTGEQRSLKVDELKKILKS